MENNRFKKVGTYSIKPVAVGLLPRGAQYTVKDLGDTMAGYAEIVRKELGVSKNGALPWTRWVQNHELTHVEESRFSPRKVMLKAKVSKIDYVLAAEDARTNTIQLSRIPDAHEGFSHGDQPLRMDLSGYVASWCAPPMVREAMREELLKRNPLNAAKMFELDTLCEKLAKGKRTVSSFVIPLARMLERLEAAPPLPGQPNPQPNPNPNPQPQPPNEDDDEEDGEEQGDDEEQQGNGKGDGEQDEDDKDEDDKDEDEDGEGEEEEGWTKPKEKEEEESDSGDGDEKGDGEDGEEDEQEGDEGDKEGEDGEEGDEDEDGGDEKGDGEKKGNPHAGEEEEQARDEQEFSGQFESDDFDPMGYQAEQESQALTHSWHIPVVLTPPLKRSILRPGTHNWSSADMGTELRDICRIASDGMVFGRRRARPGTIKRGTFLIDGSASMQLRDSDIESIINAVPHATIAVYSGGSSLAQARQWGVKGDTWIVIVGKDGKMVTDTYDRTLLPRADNNACDGPALLWLSRMPGPRFWYSDGYANGKDGTGSQSMKDEVRALCIAGRIKHITPNGYGPPQRYEGVSIDIAMRAGERHGDYCVRVLRELHCIR